MATKKEIVKEILSIKEVDSESNLMSKTNKELENILEDLNKNQPKQETFVQPQIDIESLKAELEAKIREEIMEKILSEQKSLQEKETTEVVDKKPKRKVDIDRFEQIPVMNTTNGTLIYKSRKTGATYIWSDYGSIEYLEFQELISMRSGDKAFLNEPYVIVLDDDAVDYLGLTKMYETLNKLENIEDIFSLRLEEFKDVIEKAPKGLIHTIVTKARQMHQEGTLDSISKVKYLNEKFNTDIGQRG